LAHTTNGVLARKVHYFRTGKASAVGGVARNIGVSKVDETEGRFTQVQPSCDHAMTGNGIIEKWGL
jgi:hypothetical protein